MQFRSQRGREFAGAQGSEFGQWETSGPLCEQLEARVLLHGSELPALTDLVSPNNTVVRLETNFGDVYFELYDVAGPGGAPPAPNTVSNFLGYIRRGDFDQSFFHRLAFSNNNPFVLQGGGFRFLDNTGVSNVPTQAPILNEFHPGRSNIERSIAMAKLGGQPDSATSQFFINLDNNMFLDTQPGSGGFTVFGRVANDDSWSVVLDISDLERRNFNNTHGAFTDVPVTPEFSPTVGIRESVLVTIKDIEIVKAAGITQYYTFRHYYPEGFAGSTINEFLPMGNPNSEPVHYQVIVRSEVPFGDAAQGFTMFRDRVIDTGVIPANSRGGITISRFGPGGAPGAEDLVPQGVPYSIEIWATNNLAANISHYDFGTSTGEAFTRQTALRWTFAQAEKVQGSVFDFLVWQNPNDEPVNIDITFFFNTANPVTVNVTTPMYRRGGLSLAEMPQIPNGSVFSVQLVADRQIVAALTHFDRRTDDALGSASLGTPGLGSRFGVLPLGNAGSNVADTISVLNTGNTTAVVNLTLTFTDPGQQDFERPAALIILPQRRGTFNLATIDQLADGRRYSVRLSSNTAVFADWGHAQGFGNIANRDAIANPMSDSAATRWLFAEGFMDSARAGQDVFETLSIYNPNSVFFTGENRTANITIRFRYGDGHTVTETRQVAGGRRLDIDVHSLASVLEQATPANDRFFFFVEVESDRPVVAQMWHFDLTLGNLQPSGGFSTLGMPSNTIRLDALGGIGG